MEGGLPPSVLGGGGGYPFPMLTWDLDGGVLPDTDPGNVVNPPTPSPHPLDAGGKNQPEALVHVTHQPVLHSVVLRL